MYARNCTKILLFRESVDAQLSETGGRWASETSDSQCGANKGTSTCLLASAPKRITAVVVIMIIDIIRHELSLRIFEPSVAPQLALLNKESGCGPQKLFRLLLEEEECKTNYSFTIRDCAKFTIICNDWPPDVGSANFPTF